MFLRAKFSLKNSTVFWKMGSFTFSELDEKMYITIC